MLSQAHRFAAASSFASGVSFVEVSDNFAKIHYRTGSGSDLMQALNSSRRLLQANRESRLSLGSGRYRSLFCKDLRNDKLKSLSDIRLRTAMARMAIQPRKPEPLTSAHHGGRRYRQRRLRFPLLFLRALELPRAALRLGLRSHHTHSPSVLHRGLRGSLPEKMRCFSKTPPYQLPRRSVFDR